MASTLAPTIAPDTVLSFEINPGTLLRFLEARAEKGPRLKCFEGRLYRPRARSRAFPFLTSAEVLEQLDDPEEEDTAFDENCREWARRVLVPRLGD